MTPLPERAAAIVELLEQPDPADLPPRRHALTQARKPGVGLTKERLFWAYLAHQALERSAA